MTDDLPPIIVGSAGLTGRPSVRPVETEPLEYDDDGRLIVPAPQAVGKAMPPSCLRVLSSPLPDDRGGGCAIGCPGRQRDGGCLLDIVKSAAAQGVEWSFELVHDGETVWWDYAGPELAPIPEPEEEPGPSFECPHCGEHNEQDTANFHYWCARCGKNARDAA